MGGRARRRCVPRSPTWARSCSRKRGFPPAVAAMRSSPASSSVVPREGDEKLAALLGRERAERQRGRVSLASRPGRARVEELRAREAEEEDGSVPDPGSPDGRRGRRARAARSGRLRRRAPAAAPAAIVAKRRRNAQSASSPATPSSRPSAAATPAGDGRPVVELPHELVDRARPGRLQDHLADGPVRDSLSVRGTAAHEEDRLATRGAAATRARVSTSRSRARPGRSRDGRRTRRPTRSKASRRRRSSGSRPKNGVSRRGPIEGAAGTTSRRRKARTGVGSPETDERRELRRGRRRRRASASPPRAGSRPAPPPAPGVRRRCPRCRGRASRACSPARRQHLSRVQSRCGPRARLRRRLELGAQLGQPRAHLDGRQHGAQSVVLVRDGRRRRLQRPPRRWSRAPRLRTSRRRVCIVSWQRMRSGRRISGSSSSPSSAEPARSATRHVTRRRSALAGAACGSGGTPGSPLPAEGSTARAPAAPATARSRAPRRACAEPPGRQRGPPPGDRSGRARA